MPNIVISQYKGLSDTIRSGVFGSLSKMVGIDIHSQPGMLTVHQKLTKDSGSTVTELCRVVLSASNGYQFWFSYTSGKIWARAAAGTWTLAYTTAPGAGTAGCFGAAEYNGYIYWGTQSREHRIAIADADDTWASVSLDWATFTKTDSEFHPHVVINAKLFIGDGNQIAQVDDAGTFDANRLDLLTPLRVKCFGVDDVDLVIGTIIAVTVNRCDVIRWDTVQDTWQYSRPVKENGVNSFLDTDTGLMAQAGTSGNLYEYDGIKLIKIKKIPGTWTAVKMAEVYPNATAMFDGRPIFGLSNSQASGNTTGNPADQGIYTLGSYSADYPRVLTGPDWVISPDVVASIEIGAILVEGVNLYASWKSGSSYGVDKIDYTAKYASAYIETMQIEPSSDELSDMAFAYANYNSMPASCAIVISIKKNGGSYAAMGNNASIDDTTKNQVRSEEVANARNFQIKYAFTISSNNAPIVEDIGIGTVD